MGVLWSRALLGLRGWYGHGKQGEAQDNAHQTFINEVTWAVEEGDLDTLKSLQEESSTPLFGGLEYIQFSPPLILLATSYGHVEVVKYLLELDLDVDATDTCGMSALHEACKRGRLACLELLLSRSGAIDRRDVWGRTPLIKAFVYRNTTAAKLLLEKGANPNAVDNYGMTPLSTVIDYNLLDMVSLLVYHGADVNLISCHQHQCSGPPLYRAINNQSLAAVRQLLHLGATTHPKQTHISGSSVSHSWPYLGFGGHHSSLGSLAGSPLQHENAVQMAMSELMKRGENVTRESLDILMEVLAAHGLPLGPSPVVIARVLLASGGGSDGEDTTPALDHDQEPQQHHQQQLQQPLGRQGLTQPPSASSPDVVTMLRLKLHLCSTSCQEPASLDSLTSSTTTTTPPRRRMGAVNVWRTAANLQREAGEQEGHGDPGQEETAAAAGGHGGRGRKPGAQGRTVVSLHTQSRRVARRSMMASGRNVTWATHRLSCPPALKTLLLLKDIDRAFSAKPLMIL